MSAASALTRGLLAVAVIAGATIVPAAPALADTVYLTVISGGAQDVPATLDSAPAVVKVTDADGNALEDVTVTFEIQIPDPDNNLATGTFPGGTTSTTVQTGADGQASSPAVTTGVQPGVLQVEATAPESAGGAFFTINVDSAQAVTLVKQSGDNQSVGIGGTFSALVVQALNANGVPVQPQDSQIVFTISGAGAFPGGLTQTGALIQSDGTATSPEITASVVGGQILVLAEVSDNDGSTAPSVTFTLTAAVPVATSIQITGGSGQTAPTSTTYAQPLSAKVLDQDGNPVPGAIVTFSVTGGEGTFASGLSNDSATADSEGIATSDPLTTGGQVGQLTVQAAAQGTNAVDFDLEVSFAPYAITILSGDDQTAAAGTTFPLPIVAEVLDEVGNPITNARTTFTVSGPATLGGGMTEAIIVCTTHGCEVLVNATAAGAITVSVVPTLDHSITPAEFHLTATAAVGLERDTLLPGDSVLVTATGLTPGEQVEVWLHSAPTRIGAGVANPDGAFQVRVTIPADTVPGDHRIEVRGSVSGSTFQPLHVAGGELAATGSTVAPALASATALIVVGMLGLRSRRRGGKWALPGSNR